MYDEDKLLQGYSEEERERIRELTAQLGISKDDPMFQVMAALGKCEYKVDEVINSFDGMTSSWSMMLDEKLYTFSESSKTTSQAWVNSAIKDSFAELIKVKNNSTRQFFRDGFILIRPLWIAIATGAILASGAFIGSGISYSIFLSATHKNSSISERLTPKELKVISWLESEEGQTTYKIISENMETIKFCQKNFSKLNKISKLNETCTINILENK